MSSWISSPSPTSCALIASFYPQWDQELIDRLCTEWGVDIASARIKSMSVGERQKLSILLAFGHTPGPADAR